MDDRKHIENAWESCIHLYNQGVVVSEHTLQAAFYRYLYCVRNDRTVVCEPRIEGSGIGLYFPDILILNDHAITAAIEIKFVPHGYPRFEDDLAT